MMLPLKYQRAWLILGWCLIALAIYGSLTSNPALVPSGTNDKLLHLATYATLSFWFAGIYPRSRYVWIVAGLFLLGISMELLQAWMRAGRSPEVYDMLANTLGIFLGLAIAMLVGDWAQRVERWISPA